MALPKSVVKIKRDGVEYISSVDRAQYTIHELCRAALRDVGKFIANRTRQKIKRRTGKGARNIQYWVRAKQRVPDLQVGLKPSGFYLGFQELGTGRQRKVGALSEATKENINTIQEITGKYLSAIEDENRARQLINEEEMQGE